LLLLFFSLTRFPPFRSSHLEKEFQPGNVFEVQAHAPYMVLLGDIGTIDERGLADYERFLARVAPLYERVFVVLGNHEYYRVSSCEDAPGSLRSLAASVAGNVTVLERETHDLPNGYRLLGCTLWSHVPPESAVMINFMVNDYKAISTREGVPRGTTRRVKPADTNRLHAEAVAWLEAELAKAKAQGKRCVVCTHHSPLLSATKAGTKPTDSLNTAFVSD
jgi:3',5'-cyclic AMP phosphodiesterase CpdA